MVCLELIPSSKGILGYSPRMERGMMDGDMNESHRDIVSEMNHSNELFDLYEYDLENDSASNHPKQGQVFHKDKKLWVIIGVYAAVFMMGGYFAYSISQWHHFANNNNVQENQFHDTGTVSSANTITIDVHGDVRHPGLYHLPANARVSDAISAAGGCLHERDSQSVNQAQPLIDGQEVLIANSASTPEAVTSNLTPEPSPVEGDLTEHTPILKIDLNTADEATLETISGIGPRRAQAIIAYRNAHGSFKSLFDLRHVRGFGKATLTKLSPYIFV